MKILDRYVNNCFVEDEAGNTVYYKWGIFGSGVIVDTEETKEKIRKFMKFHYIFAPASGISIGLATDGLWGFLLLFPYIIWYAVGSERLIKGLKKIPDKRRYLERFEKQAQTISWPFIWLFIFLGLFFLCISIWLIIGREDIFNGLIGVAASLFIIVVFALVGLAKKQLS